MYVNISKFVFFHEHVMILLTKMNIIKKNTYGAIEALTMIIVVQSFHPTITSFDRESAGKAFSGEQLVPIWKSKFVKYCFFTIHWFKKKVWYLWYGTLTSFAIRITILQEEWRITEQLATIDAIETFRVEVLSDSFQAILQKTLYYLCRSKKNTNTLRARLTVLILALHLEHGGAKYCSKQYSQYSWPCSSTKPMSWRGRLQEGVAQTKCCGHQILPKAVMNGPL